MAATVRLKYIGPIDAIELANVGRVKRNTEFEVHVSIAGRAPGPWQPIDKDDDGNPITPPEHHLISPDGDEHREPGEGLLAQDANFAEVAPAAAASKGA